MSRKNTAVSLFTVILIFFSGCDEGLKPNPGLGLTGFSGTIRFRNWPPPDSLIDLRVVAFRNFPPQGIVNEVLAGRAVYSPSELPLNVDSLQYSLITPAGIFSYIVVAQQFGHNIQQDWRAVGQYDLDTILTVPSAIVVEEGKITPEININVDFRNPPPPPPNP